MDQGETSRGNPRSLGVSAMMMSDAHKGAKLMNPNLVGDSICPEFEFLISGGRAVLMQRVE